MTHDFNKPPHVTSAEEKSQKKRLPVYILVLVGVFFIAVLVYMFADNKPTAEDAPPGHPEPTAQPATPNNTTTTGTATANDEAVATDADTVAEAGEKSAIGEAADNVGVGTSNKNQ
ncbi:hypothetical protein B9T26_07910 [Acinetobacter sp. ANC 4169]|uniref:hypothetical protein n=1 Tax=Acinetobacter sp. ANC 4169 TaxID=1977879 RepID=UPI000A33A379|nr:hypothetical protein [Acinetobacter sp. ANC 4169]OTG74052.1 hypothetical protein B9T26_07910 [Acinetobacter sp. ANC 4169]